MNSDMRIISKMAANPELVLKVTFEIHADHEQAADDAKTGLMELGLDDNVELN